MDLHHGEIHVFSKGEGTSSTFTVDLPMTRKIDPLVVVNNRPRRFTRERLVGLFGGQINRHHPTSPSALLPAPQVANNQAAALNSLQPMDSRPSSLFNQRPSGRIIMDDPVPLSNLSSGDRIKSNLPSQISQSSLPVKSNHSNGARIEPILPNVDEVKSVRSVMSMGRQSLRDLAEHDRMVTSAARQAKATASLRKQSTDRDSYPTRNPERGGVSTGGRPSMSPPPRDEPTRNDAVVVPGSDHVADPPSQQLRPASMTMVTSLSPPPQGFSSKAALAAAAAPPSRYPSLSALPSPSPISLSAALPRKSQKQSHNEQLPQGPVYHVLVVDDSTMTRKMLMKTLRNGGIIHSINAS